MPAATPVAMRVAQNGRFADGIYTGPPADAYYGLIQIQAIVQGGRLVGIRVLRYPSDRWTSVRINRWALPILRDEVDQRAKRQRRHHLRRHADERSLHPLDRHRLGQAGA